MHFLGCKNLERSGLAAMSFGFIAEIVAVGMVIFHSLMLAGMLDAKLEKTEVPPIRHWRMADQIFDVEVDGGKVYRDDLTGQALDPRLVRQAR